MSNYPEARQAVIKMLNASPTLERAFVVSDSNARRHVLTVALRKANATFDMEIPAANYDAFAIIEILQKIEESVCTIAKN